MREYHIFINFKKYSQELRYFWRGWVQDAGRVTRGGSGIAAANFRGKEITGITEWSSFYWGLLQWVFQDPLQS